MFVSLVKSQNWIVQFELKTIVMFVIVPVRFLKYINNTRVKPSRVTSHQ